MDRLPSTLSAIAIHQISAAGGDQSTENELLHDLLASFRTCRRVIQAGCGRPGLMRLRPTCFQRRKITRKMNASIRCRPFVDDPCPHAYPAQKCLTKIGLDPRLHAPRQGLNMITSSRRSGVSGRNCWMKRSARSSAH